MNQKKKKSKHLKSQSTVTKTNIEIVHYKTKDNERDGIMWMKPQKGQMRTRKLLCSISGPKGFKLAS